MLEVAEPLGPEALAALMLPLERERRGGLSVAGWIVSSRDLEAVRRTWDGIAYDSPQHMIEADWIQTIIIDEDANEAQRRAIETILMGGAGGPWEVLARFVGRRETTRHLPIRIRDDGNAKHVAVEGLLESTIEDIRGRDRSEPVTFENMFNQIHATSQVIATGGTRYDDGVISIEIDGTHALHSRFDWSVES